MASFALTAVLVLSTALCTAQDSIQYQLVIRDAAGQLITNKQVNMKFSLISGGQSFYEETQKTTTDKYGNISVFVGTGTAVSGSMKNVPWSTMDISMKVEADTDGGNSFKELGTVPMSAAPYAMYAATAGGNANNGSSKDDEALFEVCDRDGQPVFAVYSDGIVVYIDEVGDTKNKRSGFKVTGRNTKDGEPADYFSVDAEGTHVYIDDNADNTKNPRSGFKVTGRSTKSGGGSYAAERTADKGTGISGENVFAVSGGLTTVYVDADDSKNKRSGFVVTGRSSKDGNFVDIDAKHANLLTKLLNIVGKTDESEDPQPGEEPAQPQSLFTISGGQVGVNTGITMIGDVEKKVEAEILAETEFTVGDDVFRFVYQDLMQGVDNVKLMAIYGDGAYVPKTDGENFILFDEAGFITKQHSQAAVVLELDTDEPCVYIRPLKPMNKTIEFGLMDGNNTSEPYQFKKLTAKIEAETGSPFVLGDAFNGTVKVKGELFYGESVELTAEPDEGYIFKDWGESDLVENPRRMAISIYYEPVIAVFAAPELYVSGADNASTNNSGFYYEEPLPSIEAAVDVMARFNRPDLDWTICVVGTLNGPQKMGEAATSSTMRKEIVAQSVKLTGEYIGSGAYVGDEPKGTIDAQQGGTALLIANYTEQPVTIENLIITGGKYSQGGGLQVGDGPAQGNVIIGEGVLITGNEATGNDGAGGGVSVGGNALLTMTGGQISGNRTGETGNGGGVMLYSGATFDMQGGTIGGEETNDANNTQHGGGVFVSSGAILTMTNGGIIGNKANGSSGDGGGIYLEEGGILDMQGGQIASNTADANGGGIYSSGAIYMNGSAVVGDLSEEEPATSTEHSNKAINGGGIFNNNSLMLVGYKKPQGDAAPEADDNFTGGICYNYASANGGGISAPGYNDTEVDKIYKGSLSYNAAETDGGGFGTMGGNQGYSLLTIEKSSIIGNTAGGSGGGIFLYNWYYETETISETVIKDNYAKDNGGGIFYKSFKTLELNNCQITNNTAESGSGVHLFGDNYGASTLVMSNGSISGNNNSENVYVGSSEDQAGSISLNSGAEVADVLLDGGNATINIAGTLTSTGTAFVNITEDYLERGMQLITTADDIDFADYSSRFAVSTELQKNGWIIDSYGKLNNPDIYVAAVPAGNDGNGHDGTKDKPYETLDMAFEMLNNPDIEFTIHINGELTNCMATIPASAQAKTIRLTGVNDLDENGQPQDVIYGVWNGEENPENQGSVLSIITSTQVTISNLKITQGYATLGGGLHIAENANVIIADGTLIRNNFAAHTDGDDNTGRGGGVYVASGANLTMTGGSIAHNNGYNGGGVYNIGKFTMSGGTIAANKADTQNGKGGGVYNGGTMFMNGTAVIGDQNAKETPTAETGKHSNIAFCGGGVYDCAYFYLGFINKNTWCSGSFTGGIFYNYATNNNYGGGLSSGSVSNINGPIANNSSPTGVGVFAGQQICFEDYGAIPVGADGKSNYLKLSGSANINFRGDISGRISVVPFMYSDGQEVVWNVNQIAANYGKIDVVPNGDNYYTINSDGTLAKIGAAKFVYYVGNEQKIVDARPLAQGSTIGDAPVVDDENFVGWYPLDNDGLGSYPFVGTETIGTENLTFVAVYDKTIEVKNGGDYQTIADAVNAMDWYCNYTISVDGTINGAQTIPTDINGKINSITLCGKENQNILNGRNAPCVLAINTTVPVTIKDLIINGGKATEGNGAGVILSEGAKLTLESGATIYGNIGYNNGAGIYAKGENIEIVMNSGSEIKQNELKSQSTGSTDGAYDLGGAGIYISGAGIDDTKKLPKLTINEGAEISGNTASNHLCGGAIYVDNAIVEIDGGKITVNQCGYMAGNIMVTGSNAVVTMTAGEISYGDANAKYFLDNLVGDNAVGGGVVLKNGAQFLMDGGKIKNNSVRPLNNGYGYGAAVMIYDATFVMTDGEIFNNAVVSDETAGEGAIKVSPEGSFQIGGDAYIYADESNLIDVGKNNIFLDEGAKVTVISQLSHAVVGTITPKTYSEGLPVLTGDKDLVASECKKFAVLSQEATNGNWAISVKGKLKPIIGTKAAPNAVGDIVFTDGSAVAYDATSFSFTAHKSEAVAVIFDVANKKGVAIKEKTSRAVWCKSEAEGYDMIEGATDLDDGKKNTNAIYALSDFGKEDKEGYYPPFEYAKSYNAGGYTDWYIPAINEIVAMCDNKNIINTAISKVGGVELHSYDPSQPTLGRGYWSSTQAEHPNYVWSKSINYEQNGQIDPITTRGKSGDACWIRCVRIFDDAEEVLWDASELGDAVPSATEYPVIGISTVADLVQLASWVNNADNESQVLKGITFKMTKDIVLDESFNAPIGMGWGDFNGQSDNGTPHKSFWGIFDGNGHTISGFNTDYFDPDPQTNDLTPYPALFGNVTGKVKNLTLEGVSKYGGIVGCLWGEVRNCESKVNINKEGNNAAGIVMNAREGKIVACVNSGTITTSWSSSGGIVGDCGNSTSIIIDSCINKGKITGYNAIGGIIGYNRATIRNCVNTADVEVLDSYLTDKPGGLASGGGIAGYHDVSSGSIENCYNSGKISGKNGIGGILGLIQENDKITINNCYNRGEISTSPEDGLKGAIVGSVGEDATAAVSGNFFVVNNENNIHGIGGTTVDDESQTKPFGTDGISDMFESLNTWVTKQNQTKVQYTPWKIGGDGYPVLNFEE